jgi:hypothetical protein
MGIQVGRNRGVHFVQELAELQGTVAAVALADHLAGLNIQGSKKRRCTASEVIVGAPFHLTRTHGQ